MSQPTDPVEDGYDGDDDLYDVTRWEVRSPVDRLATAIHGAITNNKGRFLVALALLVFLGQLGLTGYAIATSPTLGVLTVISVVPAFALAAFIWYEDVTMREPWETLAITFLLGVLFASFAAVVNSALKLAFGLIPLVGTILFFFLVVGPIEETVKILAVRVHAFNTSEFDAVVDGAVYGAVAGLGFATIENSLYITREVLTAAQNSGAASQLQVALQTATSRAFAGPGHVIYSAFAGYYLGLAKFNPENRGPIVVKGLLIATVIHATYNTLVTVLPFGGGVAFIGFVILYDGVFGYLLYRKLARYKHRHREATTQKQAVATDD
ncbi:PrsW family intramembrane metalloprotease [Haladaptatus sp. DYSN1]|uniref:PrsW family intramembrane metalloprotease n=1 Tax=unclassified Haladaptatus TaxID=2622732 RepID=UPI002405F7F7|nr:PrsW family glutamic-type intramembrane protease [Haladaptatus sp. DYSN1]